MPDKPQIMINLEDWDTFQEERRQLRMIAGAVDDLLDARSDGQDLTPPLDALAGVVKGIRNINSQVYRVNSPKPPTDG